VSRLTTLLLALAVARAQDPAPRSGQATGAGANSVIRIDVNLVQVDAVVTDSRGRRVTNLPATAFEIFQDGKPQTITDFSYVSTKSAEGAGAPQRIAHTKPVNGEPPPPPPLTRPTEVRRTLALIVDDLGLAGESIGPVRGAIRNFIDDQMRPGDLVAIVRTSAGMGALQQFTTDKRLLYAALERVKYGESRVGVSSFAPLGSRTRGGAAINQLREDSFAVGSLGAIRFVVNAMKDFPGRKSVVLFTENIRMIFRGSTDQMVEQAVRQLSDAASRASVVIHAIDPRGMPDYSVTPADDTAGMSRRRLSRVPAQRQAEEIQTQEGMFVLAEETGGLFLHDTNDLAGALKKAAEDSDGYYLIGYHPESNTFENSNGQPKFHKIDVKVKGAGGPHVRSRQGFLGEPGANHPLDHTREAELTHALQSPFMAGAIHPRLTAIFSNVPAGSFINALLYFSPGELKWSSEPDGKRKASIDVAAATFDENGLALAPIDTTFTLQLTSQEFDEGLKKGMVYGINVPVKKPGPYLVRAAVRDPATEASGSAEQYVDVPDVESGRLAMSGIVFVETKVEANAKADPRLPQANATEGSGLRENFAGEAARRVFRRGTVLLYAYEIFNAQTDKMKTGGSQIPEFEVQTRMFRDGEQVFNVKTAPTVGAGASDPRRVKMEGHLSLGSDLPPGEYVLQVIVTDKLAKGKFGTASQSMDFEIEQ
jgi:VWFA-related protein